MLTSSTQSMWGVNPHKTVSSQTRRKKTHMAFLIFLFNILWKRTSWTSNLKPSFEE